MLKHELDRINQTSRQLQEYQFDKSGVFTNSMVNLPDPIRLIKDSNEDENLLYKIVNLPNGDSQPIRVDGRVLYNFENSEYNSIVKPLSLDYDSPSFANQLVLSNDLKEKLQQLINFINEYPNLIENHSQIKNELKKLVEKYNDEISQIDQLSKSKEKPFDIDESLQKEEQLIEELEMKIGHLNRGLLES